MSLFGSPIEAWHAAFATREGVQDPFSNKVIGTCGSDMCGVKEAELAKVVKVINALDPVLHACGMWCYLPAEHVDLIAYRNKIYEQLWSQAVPANPQRLNNFQRTTRLQIMISHAAVDARSRSGEKGASEYSHAQVASHMGISRAGFLKSWRDDYESLIVSVLNAASLALVEIDPVLESINERYAR